MENKNVKIGLKRYGGVKWVLILTALFFSFFNAETVKATTPDQISGLKLWLKADAITGLSDGAAVSSWADSSTNGNNATQSNASYKPTYKTNILNNEPVVRFNGTNNFLTFTSSINTIRTAFFVVKWSGSYNDYAPLLGDPTLYDFNGGAGALLFDSTYVTTSILNGSVYVNGGLTSAISAVKPLSASVISIVTTGNVRASQITNDRNAVGRYWSGDYAEVIIYDTVLSDSDRQAIETYLGNKYAITISVPNITSIYPTTTTAGGNSFTLTVNGSNFTTSSVVQISSANRTTTFVSSTQITAVIPSADISISATATIKVNNPGVGISNAQTLIINNVVTDSFSGTSIDTSKWTETDSAVGGQGGTAGNVQYNNALTVAGNNNWGANGVQSKYIYDRSSGDVVIQTDVKSSDCSSATTTIGIGYGDLNIYANPGDAYILSHNTGVFNFFYIHNGVVQLSAPTIYSCVNNTSSTLKLVALKSGGAQIYVNNVLAISTALGTFTNKRIFLQSYSQNTTTTYNNFSLSGVLTPTINHILSTGQSLSLGYGGSPALTTVQPYSNKMLSGNSFTALVESSVETISSAMANLITSEAPLSNYQTEVTIHGQSATA